MIYVLLWYHISVYSGEIDKIQVIGEFKTKQLCVEQIDKNKLLRKVFPAKDDDERKEANMNYACGERELN